MLTASQDPETHLEALVGAFEQCTLPYADWNHRAHLSVAFCYLDRFTEGEATERIRSGIKAYNASQGIEQTETGGYHDSLTIFFAQLIGEFLAAAPPAATRGDLLEELCSSCSDRALPLRFYSHPRLMSPEARFGWLEPDLAPVRGSWNEHVFIVSGCDAQLLAQAEAQMRSLYATVEPFAMEQAVAGLTAWWHNQPVGCVALCAFEADSLELRRLYVAGPARGRGVARKLLDRLEQWAAQAGYQKLVLETGPSQGEALALYSSAGYRPRPPFGPYLDNPESRCFEKALKVRGR